MEAIRLHTLGGSKPSPEAAAAFSVTSGPQHEVCGARRAARMANVIKAAKLTWMKNAFGSNGFPVASDDGLIAGPCTVDGSRPVNTVQLQLSDMQNLDLLYFEVRLRETAVVLLG
jgi:hypothetical protein